MVKGGDSAKHTFTSFCAIYTRRWTPAYMVCMRNIRRTYAAQLTYAAYNVKVI